MVIHSEIIGDSNTCVHYINPNEELNLGDHADHIATGQAIQAMPIITSMEQVLYMGYNYSHNSMLLQPDDLFWKAGMFAAYEKAVFDLAGYSTLHEDAELYVKWCVRGAQFTTIPSLIQH